jgi:hypothetical protein
LSGFADAFFVYTAMNLSIAFSSVHSIVMMIIFLSGWVAIFCLLPLSVLMRCGEVLVETP